MTFQKILRTWTNNARDLFQHELFEVDALPTLSETGKWTHRVLKRLIKWEQARTGLFDQEMASLGPGCIPTSNWFGPRKCLPRQKFDDGSKTDMSICHRAVLSTIRTWTSYHIYSQATHNKLSLRVCSFVWLNQPSLNHVDVDDNAGWIPLQSRPMWSRGGPTKWVLPCTAAVLRQTASSGL